MNYSYNNDKKAEGGAAPGRKKNMVTISPVGAGDAQALAEMQKQAFLPLYEIYHDDKNPALRGAEDILVRLGSPRFFYRKILSDGELVGGVLFRKSGEGEYYLQRIYVSPASQSRGAATAALLLCEAELPGAKRFTVEFPEDRPMNRRCYEKAGYTDTGRREKISESLTLAVFEKRVN